MKKVFTKYIAALSVFSFLAGFFVSCGDNSGLGAAIDQIAPQISLISHSDNDTVPVEFTLAGTVWDNEKVSSFTIDFDDADLHYKIVPGGKWYKKTSVQDWTQLSDTEASCNANGLTWNWTLLVDTEEASTAWTEDTYEFTAVAQDLIGNSGKSSKLDCSLIVDTANPDVSVYKPDLFKSTYTDAVSSMESYQLNDGNVIARLLNGDLKFSGRQSGSLSFKELLIEFDDGDSSKLAGNACLQTDLTAYPSLTSPTATAQQVADTVMLTGETEKPEVYYSKLITEDSRSWEFTVKADEWVSETKNPSLQTGKHLIRVVASSVSNSYAWEKKVLGYFVWWPEADTPWITTYAGDNEDKGSSAYEVYPSSNFSGTAQDDDGIKSLSYVIEKKDNDTFKSYSSGNLSLSEAGAKYSAWAVTTPSENANYKITVTVVDLYGKSSAVTKYFKILDVSPPKIEISAPLSGSSAIANSDGTINFEGTVSDDGTVTSLYVAFLNSNPLVNTAVQNKINYMSGSSSTALWTSGTEAGYTDSDGNIIYKINLGTPVVQNNKNVYSFSKSFNLFDDLQIDGTLKTIEALDFVFRAEDSGGTNSVQVLSLSGDTEAPEVAITKLVLKENGTVKNTYNFDGSETPTLPKIKSGFTAELSGTWSDNSTANWIDKYKLKICNLVLTWNDNTISATMNKAGTWTASVTSAQLPTASGIIKAKLTDFGGNSKTASQSVFIESSEAGLESIGCENDDGAYKAGEEIQITLEFTKSTDVDTSEGIPTLTLNNGKTATYSSGSGSAKHIYTYIVVSGDDINRLDVEKINPNGAVWSDTASSGTELNVVEVTLPAENKRIGATRYIKIDTTAPSISSITAISSAGYYKEGSQILLMMSFSENVTITNGESLVLKFAHNNAESDSAAVSGSNVIFTYVVGENENTEKLTLSDLTATGVTAEDEAGNTVSAWNLPATPLSKTIVVDTTKPDAPVITRDWTSSVVLDEGGTSFTITGEDGATIEYTTDGTNYQTYRGSAVTLTNNGTYTISALQTDKAGNISESSAQYSVTIDTGALLSKVTASTVSGTYSTKTNTKSVTGKIVFRRDVTIPASSKVTLNVKNNSKSGTEAESRTVAINEAGTTASSYTFTYTIEEGDYIENNAALDVTGWSFNTVDVAYSTGTLTSDISLPVTGDGSGKAFGDNREIYILTGIPAVTGVDLSGEGSDAVLTVTFDREISKVNGNIVFTQDEDSYRAPSVLSVTEYSELKDSLSSYYTKGMNGAAESSGYLTNDTTTKYVLNYATENTDSGLTGIFKTARKHIVTVPVVSSAVAADENKLIVTLGSTYELPTKGAAYKLSIPAEAVTDEAQNKNESYETDGTTTKPNLVAEGIEKPVIRINKPGQEITSSGVTANSSVTMPLSASVKIDCQTPDTIIYSGINAVYSSTVTVQKSPYYYNTKTTDASVPTSFTANQTTFTIGGGTETASYDTKGIKAAIAAYAKKGNVSSEKSYEYATRTVLKFIVDSSDASDTNANQTTSIYETISGTSTQLKFKDLKVWVVGGDSPYGGNSIDPFPLEWNNSSGFKLMDGSWTTTDGELLGSWYWITWDITAKTYHGFAIGDVPSDAQSAGPTYWYMGECAWVAQKSNYVLYPGETLEMAITGSQYNYQAKFLFRYKNEGTR